MTLTTAQQVRLRIQDQPLIADATYYGDGRAALFQLPHRNITSGTAYVLGSNGQWSATGASIDSSGYVAFSGTVSANSGFRMRYVHSTFSDDEIDHFAEVGATVNGAALEAVQTLMFDGLKRASWASPDGTRYDDTAAMGLLRDMYDKLKEELDGETVIGGDMPSWSMSQGDY